MIVPKKAKLLLDTARDKRNAGAFSLRSCWNCESGHVHLKDVRGSLILCFVCGHWYLDGEDLTELTVKYDLP